MENKSKPASRIVLVRHGHVDGIVPERFRGLRDVELSDVGIRQAQATARWIARQWHPVIAYTSPLKRCVQTAQQIATACNTSCRILDDLTDIDYGDCEWCTHEEVRAQRPELYERWLSQPHLVQFPRGESLQDLAARASRILRLVAMQHPQEVVVVVGHSVGNRVLLLQALDAPLSAYWRLGQDPCGVSEIELLAGAPTVRLMNEIQHLDDT